MPRVTQGMVLSGYGDRRRIGGADGRCWVVAGGRSAGADWRGAGRLCRPEFSDALLAVGSGPQVGVVDRVAVQGPAAFVDEFVVEVAEPRGIIEAGGAAAA